MTKHHSNVFARGTVVGVKKFDFKKPGSGKLNITVEADGRRLTMQYFFSNNKVKYNKQAMKPTELMRKFVDAEGVVLGTRVIIYGLYYENGYTASDGRNVIYNEARALSISTVGDDVEYLSFNTAGIVESVTPIDEVTRVRLGIIGEKYSSKLKQNVPDVKYLNVILDENYFNTVDGELSEYGLDDVVEGAEIELVGSIVYNSGAKIDQFGRRKAGGQKNGNYVVSIDNINEYPDMEEYERVKSGYYEKTDEEIDRDADLLDDDDFDLEDDDFSDEDAPF